MSSFQICSVDNDLRGNHNCLVEVKAQVMTRDNALGMWVPHSGGGMSRVGLFQATDATAEADLGHIQYVINGYRMSDDVVIMHCALTTDFQYMKVNPTFHHWSVKEKRFGLTFQTFGDATAFEKTINSVLENLRSTGAVMTLPFRDGTSSWSSSPKATVALPKETEMRPRLPQKMNQRPITQDTHVLPNQTHCSPGSYSQPKDRLGSICSLETIPGVAPTSTLARRSSSAEFTVAASVCAHGSSEVLPPRLPFISSQSKSDSGPQSRPEEGPQPGPDVPPRSKSDCGLETQPLVHMQRSSRPKVVDERSTLSPSEYTTRRPSPKLPENAIPFPYACSPITPKVVVQCIDKKRAQTPPPPVPLRLDDSRRRRYEPKQAPFLLCGGISDPTWDDALYDDLHRKLMSVPASGGFTSDPTAIYVTGPYVHFTKDKETPGYPEKNEYFYPNLDPVSSLPPVSSQRGLALQNAYRDYRNLAKTDVQPPVPPLPIKQQQRRGMNWAKDLPPRKSSDLYRSDSANFKSKCTYCGEYFSPKENRRGACADGPDAFRDCAKSCVCPAAALVYHCADEEDGVATDLWTCGASDRRSCRQWTVLTIVCLLLPCMWCFLPMRSCHRCGVACGCCGARHQAALPLASNV